MSDKKVSVRLVAEGGGQVKAELQGIGDTGSRSFKTMSTDAEGLNSRIGTLAGPAGLGMIAKAAAAAAAALLSVGTAIRIIGEFESGMAQLGAVTGATAAEMEALRDVAKDLGSSTEFTAKQAADGLAFLARAGFDASEAMAAIPAVLDLATAASMDLATAADISSNIMSAFGIAASDAASVADVLAAAAASANTNVNQLGDAMTFVGPIASALDIAMSDAAAAIGVLSDAGIQGGMAGTSLRQILSGLINPVGEAAAAIRSLNLTIEEVDPATNSLADIISALADAGIGASEAMAIFGDRGGPAILALTSQSGRLQDLTKELKNVDGTASSMADTIRDQLQGDIDGLRSAAEGLIIALGDAGLTAIIRGAVQSLTLMIRSAIELTNAISAITGFVSRTTRDLLGLSQATQDTALAFGAAEMAIDAEIAALGRLREEIEPGTEMSRGMAIVKMRQAEAHLATVDAMRAEANEIIRQSQEYKNLQSQIRDASFFVTELRQNSERDGGMFAPNANREGLETNMALLQAAVREQELLLSSTSKMDEHYESAKATLDLINQALSEATGNTVTFGGEMATVADNTAAVARELEKVNEQNRIAAGYRGSQAVQGGRGGVVPTAIDSFIASTGGIRVPTPEEPTTRRSGGGGGGRSSAASEAEKQAEAIEKVIEALKFETEMIGVSDQVRRTHDELRKAGIDLYSEEGQAIADMVEELTRLEEQQSRNATAMQAIESASQSAFTSFVTSAKSAREAAAGLLSSLADMAANSAFQSLAGGFFGGGGGGIFGNFIGSVFGGGVAAPSFAGGGFTGSGPRTGGLDGQGGFMAMLHPNETVIDHTRGGDGGEKVLHVYVHPSGEFDSRVEGSALKVYNAREGSTIRKSVSAVYSTNSEVALG